MTTDMPRDLVEMEDKIAAGVDPDEIKGIERLWLYRMERDRVALNKFFNWLVKQPPNLRHG
jgi:hypothetical protein